LRASAADHSFAVASARDVYIGPVYQQGETAAVDWPVQVGSPPLPAVAFQQRPTLSDQLVPASSSTSAVLVQLIAGDGGVGKSQLAAAAFRAARSTGVELAVWVDASSRSSIVAGLASASSRLRLPAAGDAEQAASEFIDWVATTTRSWLVVFDDVADPADVSGLWPRGPSGRAIVTTRRQDLQLADAVKVPVGVYLPDESMAYLRDKLAGEERPDVLSGAAELAAGLGHLPLALAQAAAVVTFDGSTCAEYRDLLTRRSSKLMELFPAVARADDYARTVASAWSLAIERADQLPPVGIARAVLEIAAVLNPNGIPVELWRTPSVVAQIKVRMPEYEWPAEPVQVEQLIQRGLAHLRRLSLITSSSAGAGHELVRIHGLVQRAVLDELSDPEIQAAVHASATGLLTIWPTIENESGYSAVLRQNASSLSSRHETALLVPQVHPLLFQAANSLAQVGQIDSAHVAMTRLNVACDGLLGTDHRDTLSTRYYLASWRGEAGDAAGAVVDLEQLLTDLFRVLGVDHRDTLRARNSLASWRGEAGDPAAAVTACEELLVDLLREYGPGHPDTLVLQSNLAHWRGHAGDTAGAALAYEELLADRLRVLGPDHPDTLITRSNLASWRGHAGDAAGAAAATEELLADRLRVLGPDHPDTLITRSNLASWRGHAGDAAGAALAYEELLADRLRVLGPDHPDTLRTRNNLASWRGRAGDAAGAAAAFEELLAVLPQVLGPDHPNTLRTRNNLASWRGEAGDAAGAAAALEELLADQLRALGPNHLDALSTRSNLASWRGKAGDAAGAAAALEELLADQLQLFEPDHPNTLRTRRGLAYWRHQAGEANRPTK